MPVSSGKHAGLRSTPATPVTWLQGAPRITRPCAECASYSACRPTATEFRDAGQQQACACPFGGKGSPGPPTAATFRRFHRAAIARWQPHPGTTTHAESLTLVLGREAALAGDVDDQHDLALEGRGHQVVALGVLQDNKSGQQMPASIYCPVRTACGVAARQWRERARSIRRGSVRALSAGRSKKDAMLARCGWASWLKAGCCFCCCGAASAAFRDSIETAHGVRSRHSAPGGSRSTSSGVL